MLLINEVAVDPYETMDPFTVLDASGFALETIAELQDKVFALEAAKQAPAVQQAVVLRLARQHRQSLIERFQVTGVFSHVFATETLDNPKSLVLALEAEENESKGLITKLVDAIVKAFEWLWEKFTGLFKSGETPEEAVKGIKSIEDRLEEAIKAGKELPAGAALEAKRWATSLGPLLGASATLGQVTPLVHQHLEYKKRLSSAIELLSKALKDASAVSNLLKNDSTADKFTEAFTEWSTKIDGALKNSLQTPYKADEHGEYALLTGTVVPVADKSYAVGPIAGKGGPVVVGVLLTGTAPAIKYVAKAAKRKTKAEGTSFKLSLPGKLEELKVFLEEVKKLRLANTEAAAEMTRQQGAIKSDFGTIQSTLNDIKKAEGKTKEASQAVMKFLSFVKSCGGIEVALGAGMKEMDSARENFEAIIAQVLNLAEGKKAEEGEAATEEKPEEKPTEAGTPPAAA